jgi:hypothetical protein
MICHFISSGFQPSGYNFIYLGEVKKVKSKPVYPLIFIQPNACTEVEIGPLEVKLPQL